MVMSVKGEKALKSCPRCAKLRPVDSLLSLCPICRTAACKLCHSIAFRLNSRLCPCGSEFSLSTLSEIQLITLDCSLCKRSQPGCEFSTVECADHLLCQNCLVTCYTETGKCGRCDRPFTPEEVAVIENFKEVICDECWDECRFNRIDMNCQCKLCVSCAVKISVEVKRIATCGKCKALLPRSTTAILSQRKAEPASACQLCGKLDKSQEMAGRTRCDHRFHQACLRKYVEENVAKTRSLQTGVCPAYGCSRKFTEQEVKEIVRIFALPKDVWSTDERQCPRCKGISTQQSGGNMRKCSICQIQYCLQCRSELISTFHNPTLCNYLCIKLMVQFAELGNSASVTQCPSCKSPYITSQCFPGTVTCSNDHCQTKFCFSCAAPAQGYLAHGNAWHRPSCALYNKEDWRCGRQEGCEKCAKAGVECSPPIDLAVPRRFQCQEE